MASSYGSEDTSSARPFRVIEGSEIYEVGTNKTMTSNDSFERTAASFMLEEESTANNSVRGRPKKLSNLGSFRNIIGRFASSSPSSASSTNYSKFEDGEKKRKSSFFRTKSDDDDDIL